MRSRIIKKSFAGFLLIMASCARPSGYEGWVTRSYCVRGEWYHPLSVQQAMCYEEEGLASWYNESKCFGILRGDTSLGEKVMPWHLTGAHRTLPLPCLVRVTHLRNGRTVKIRVNDRGPFIAGRIIDLSPRAAARLDMKDQGLAPVRVEVLAIGDGRYRKKASRRDWWSIRLFAGKT